MAKFVSKAKMSKRARKELAKQNRVTWDMSPVTRMTRNKKIYDRKKNSRERFDEPPGVFSCRSLVEIAGYVRRHIVVCRSAAL